MPALGEGFILKTRTSDTWYRFIATPPTAQFMSARGFHGL